LDIQNIRRNGIVRCSNATATRYVLPLSLVKYDNARISIAAISTLKSNARTSHTFVLAALSNVPTTTVSKTFTFAALQVIALQIGLGNTAAVVEVDSVVVA
jgi:hypothetical protein